MEVVFFILMFSVPAVVVVSLVLTLQTRTRLKRVASVANRCWKRQVAGDMQSISGGSMEPQKVEAYVTDMFADD